MNYDKLKDRVYRDQFISETAEKIIINEGVYFSESEELLKFQEMCDKYINDPSFKLTDVNNRREFEKSIEDLINCDTCFITYTDQGYHTLLPVARFDNPELFKEGVKGRRELIVNEKGAKFKNKQGKVVYIFIPPRTDFITRKLTSREFAAVLLHEIGHNMDVTTSTRVLNTIMIFNPVLLLYTVGYNVVREALFFARRNKAVNFLFNMINIPLSFIGHHSMMLTHSVITMLGIGAYYRGLSWIYNLPGSLIGATLGFQAERFADSFATAYGYSQDLVSGLKKLTLDSEINDLSKVSGFFRFYYGIANIAKESLRNSPHMSTVNRLASNIGYLQSCISEVKHPDIKKKMMKDLNENIAMLEAFANGDEGTIYEQLKAKKILSDRDNIKPADIRMALDKITQDYQKNLRSYTKTNKKK